MVYVMFFFSTTFLDKGYVWCVAAFIVLWGEKDQTINENQPFWKFCWKHDCVFRLIRVGSFTSGEVGRDRPQWNLWQTNTAPFY